jgi:protein TonB
MRLRAGLCLALALALAPTPAPAQSDAIPLDPVTVEARHVFHPPMYRSTPPPAYPPFARDRGLEGAGLFDVQVLKDGRVGEVKVKQSTGATVLDQAAAQTIRSWTFEPGRRGPKAVDSWVEVPVRFSLKQR